MSGSVVWYRPDAVDSKRQNGVFHSMTATTSPPPTVSPGAMRISLIVPAFSAAIWFSIFIASSTTTG